MIASAVASPAAIDSGVCLRRHVVSIPSGFTSASPSASRKFVPLTSTFYPLRKDVVRNSRAFESRILATASTEPVATNEAETKSEFLDNKETDSKNVTVPFSRGATPSKKGKNPKSLSSSASQMKKVDYFPVLRYPLATEAAIKAMSESNTLVFSVDKRADKNTIKDEVMRLFKVKAKKVNTSITPDGNKKAFIMLAPEFVAGDVLKKIKVM